MGNTLSGNTDYRVSGQELIELGCKIDMVSRDIKFRVSNMTEALCDVRADGDSVVKMTARFGVETVRMMEILADFNRALLGIGFKLAHTPIVAAKESEAQA